MTNRLLPLLALSSLIVTGLMNATQASTSPQSESMGPAFDVVAIRPSDPEARKNGCYMKGQPGGQTFVGRCIPLRLLITYAYKIIDSQLVGAPRWVDTELYDFEAKSERSLTRAELDPMFRTLLADRFKLQLHRETRALPSLTLAVDKSGIKMTPNDGPNTWEIAIMPVPGSTMPKFKGTRCPMSYLSWWVAQRMNRPVVENTGLAGFWDFTLEFVPEGTAELVRKSPGGEPLPPVDGPTLITALREQLGLRLETAKGPAPVYSIDHVERPAAN
jgi:uncharacterized protein (TIGR03435 family)